MIFKHFGKFQRYIGFTLAEVLITLGIIGIVASLTIVPLISQYKKIQYVAKFKETYSIINQAITKYESDMGCVGDLQCTGLFNDLIDNNIDKWDYFVTNYFKVLKNCRTDVGAGCFSSATKYLNAAGTNNYDDANWLYKFVLINGTSVGFHRQTNCNFYGSYFEYCGEVYIDINGLAEPNTEGRDSFSQHSVITTRRKGIMPLWGTKAHSQYVWSDDLHAWDSGNTSLNCTTESDSYGFGCAARIMDEGWQMLY